MARVKRSVTGRKKRRTVLERASGYRGSRGRLYRSAREQVLHSLRYSYNDRRKRKGDFRRLWIARIHAAARLTGWARDEALGRPYGEVLRLRHTAGFLVHERADPFIVAPRLATGSPEREYMLTCRDGTERWVAVRTAYGWKDGTLDEVVATIRDIGRRHRRERSAYDLIAT